MIWGLVTMVFASTINLSTAYPANHLIKPNLVKAVIDSARIIGLPSSRSAKLHARKIQMSDPATQQVSVDPKLLSDRKLFFRDYFK
jgi:hypothetical protein